MINNLKIFEKTPVMFFGEYDSREIDISEQDDNLWYISVLDIQTGLYERCGNVEHTGTIDDVLKYTLNNIKNYKFY